MFLKGIQRGVVTVPPGQFSGTATITSVNPAKSSVRLLGRSTSSGTPLADLGRRMLGWSIELTNSTTVTARSGTNQHSQTTFVGFEVVEFL